jgi:hypothetical protein
VEFLLFRIPAVGPTVTALTPYARIVQKHNGKDAQLLMGRFRNAGFSARV